jgi:NADH-quinone oxidoreductase subunit C
MKLMNLTEILEHLQSQLPSAGVTAVTPETGDPWITVPAEHLRVVCLMLRDDEQLAFDYLRCLSGVDTGEQMLTVYHLLSLKHRHTVVLKVELDRNSPEVDSVQDIWRSANWFERETWDLLGIRFAGHPDLTRLMLPADWVGHPLRKDYQEQPEYHGMPTTRPNLLGGKDA